MKEIVVEGLKLCNLHVKVMDNVQFDADSAQAFLQVQYNFEHSQNKSICYRIVVGETSDKALFHVKCEYRFKLVDDDFLDQEIVATVMDLLQPRIEEVLALITFESGYAPSEKIDN